MAIPTLSKEDRACFDIYMCVHVSQLKDYPRCISNAWHVGKDIHDRERAIVQSISLKPGIISKGIINPDLEAS